MKKFIYLILCSLFVLSNTNYVNAETKQITLQDVVNQIEKDEFYSSANSETTEITLTHDEDSIDYTYTIITENGEKKVYKTSFKYSNGVISNKFSGDKESSEGYYQIFLDNLAANGIIYAVGVLNGENEDMLWEMFDDMSVYSYQKNGLKYQTFQYSNKDVDGWEIEEQGIEEFKIDINNFNLEGDANLTEPTSSKLSEDNTKASDILPIIIVIIVCIVVVSVIIVLIIKKRSKK